MKPTSSPGQASVRVDSRDDPNPAGFRLAVLSTPDDREGALDVLRVTLGLNEIDAKTRLRHVPAIMPEIFEEQPAKLAAEQLRSLGVTASAVPVKDVRDLPTARLLHHVRCEEEGLVIMSIAGEPEETIAWENVALMCIADITGLRQKSFSGLPVGVFRHARGVTHFETITETHGLEIWLVCVTPLAAYRIDAELMNYEYLADRRSPSTAANFAELVADIRRYSHHLALTATAEAYFGGPSAGMCKLPSAAAHREAVLAHWVVQHGTQSPVPSPKQSPRNERATAAKPPLWDDRLDQAHRKLHKQVDALRELCDELRGSASTADSALLRQVGELRRTIDEHFKLEEDGGYMQTVLDAAPRYNRLVESLRQQHNSFRDQLSRLSEPSGHRTDAVQEFIEGLEAHEHAENALVQSAFSDDLAAGD